MLNVSTIMLVILPDKLYSLFYKCSIIYHCDSVKNAPNKYFNPRSFRVRIFMFKDLWEVLFYSLFSISKFARRGSGVLGEPLHWVPGQLLLRWWLWRPGLHRQHLLGHQILQVMGASEDRVLPERSDLEVNSKQVAVVIGIWNMMIPFQDLLLWTRRRKMIVLPNIFMMNTRMTPPCSTPLVK